MSSTEAGRRTLLDRGGQAPVPLGAIGFQLRFVGHRVDQRVVEGVIGARGEAHLIDQLRVQQSSNTGLIPSVATSSASKRAPITAAAFNVRLAGVLRRSMRASMATCTVAGTSSSATSARQTYPVLTGHHPALYQLADHLFGEKRAPGGPGGDDRRQLADRGIRPQQVTQQPHGIRICQWGKRYRLGAGHPLQRLPSYSGREVISTIDGVRGITARKSASIDSLTASIQCASSMM